jgi:hypothetical protein
MLRRTFLFRRYIPKVNIFWTIKYVYLTLPFDVEKMNLRGQKNIVTS